MRRSGEHAGRTMDHAVARGIHLFNTQKFFEAHEALEAVWLEAQGDDKIFLHGLIQIAAAFHHHTRGNTAGFRSLLDKGLKKLERLERGERGVNLGGLRRQLESWREYLGRPRSRAARAPRLPRISRSATSGW